VFVWRSFYGMRIGAGQRTPAGAQVGAVARSK